MKRVALSVLLLAVLPAAYCAPLTPLDRGNISAGLFLSNLSVSGDLNAEAAFEGELHQFAETFAAGHRSTVQLFEVAWSPGERHEFVVNYHHEDRRRIFRLNEELRFEDELFPINAEVRTRLRFSSLTAHYTAWLHSTKTSAFGLQFGVMQLSASARLRGRVIANGDAHDMQAGVSDHVYAPLIGVAGRHLFGQKVRGFYRLQAMQLDFNGFEGRALSASAGIEYFPRGNLGLVLRYSHARIRVTHQRETYGGALELGLDGPQLLLKQRF